MTSIIFASILKRTGYFFWDNWPVLLAIISTIFIVIGLYSYCKKETVINNEEIRREQEIIANTETNRLNETLNQSNVAINAAMEPAKRAAENTEKAKQRKGNVSGEELDKLAQENK